MTKRVDHEGLAAAHTRMRRRIRHHYYRVMPDRAHHRAAVWSVFWVAAAILVVQIIYPLDRTLPLAYWQGQHRGYESELTVAADIQKAFDDTTLRLIVDDQSAEVPLGALGAEPQAATTVEQLRDYPFWQRYIPLSLLMPRTAGPVPLTYTNAVATPACQQYADELSRPAVNASIRLEDGQLIATDDVDGLTVTADDLCRQIQAQDITLGDTIKLTVQADRTTADKTSDDFAAVADQARQALNRELTLVYQDRIFTPPSTQRAEWLQLSGEGEQTALAINQSSVEAYLTEIDQQIGRDPGQTNIHIVNGREAGRDEGQPGQAIDRQPVVQQVQAQLLGQQPVSPITLTLRDVAPTIIYNNRYTATQEGLQAYVSDAARDYNAHIMIQQLDGPGWQAGARQHESIPSASTYKLYVAMKLFDDMAAGRTSWNAPMLGTTVSACFDRMTIASTNPCAEEWLRQWGRQGINQYLYDHGFSQGTNFAHPVAIHSTAADLTNYMARLARGELYDDVYRQRLLQSIGNHPFPYGIPAGSAGRVYDKVGFLWDYVHDAAIVEHPRGRYVMTIMTKGQSYARIAQITREVERIMYP